ncbi:MAG TPA: hypothetical protein VGJ84_18890 [Polyangiaceae bacterium]
MSTCRGVEVSPSGILLDRGRPVTTSDDTMLVALELNLPERSRPLRALARPVWAFGSQQAFKFIRISDVDRLNLAEHLDVLWLRHEKMN